MPLTSFPGSPSVGSAVYGWTSPGGREYGIIGLYNGTAVVDITNPTSPVLVGHIPGPSSQWHEMVTHGNYLYAVNETSGGVQIINLTNADTGSVTLSGTYTASGLSTVHTIQTNPASNTLYLNGSNRYSGALLALNIAGNGTLSFAGAWTSTGSRYVHDSTIVNFTSGPNAGKEICFANCGRSGLYIIDVTNKAAMTTLGSIDIYLSPPNGPGGGYTHSGVLTPDGHYYIVNDELDEDDGRTSWPTTYVFDVSDLSNPTLAYTFTNTAATFIDHNSNLINGYLLLSAYEGGVRVYDARNPLALTETGYYDTYPASTNFSFNGVWGVYGYFASGNLVASDRQSGLWVLDPSEAMGLGAPITDITVNDGVHMGGGAKEARKSDNGYYQVSFAPRLWAEILPTTTATFGLQTTVTPSNFVDIVVEGKVSGVQNAYTLVQAKNKNTGQWVNLGAFVLLSTTDIQRTFTNLPGSSYVQNGGRIDIRLLTVDFSGGTQMTASFDMVRATVRKS